MTVCANLDWSGLAGGHSLTNGIRPARLYGWTSRLHGTPDRNYIMTMYSLTALPSVISGNSSAPPSGNSFSCTVTTQNLSRNRSVHIRYAIRCAGTSISILRHAGQVADPEQPFTEFPPDRTGRGSACTCSTVQGSSLQRLHCKHQSVVLRGAIAIGPVYSPRHPGRKLHDRNYLPLLVGILWWLAGT